MFPAQLGGNDIARVNVNVLPLAAIELPYALIVHWLFPIIPLVLPLINGAPANGPPASPAPSTR